ncbi:MAG: hypothetical protein IKR48_09620 [Kiritimatiellae bacterium]|nr:hypothetical protein [Kiritimatiellia bacterium]
MRISNANIQQPASLVVRPWTLRYAGETSVPEGAVVAGTDAEACPSHFFDRRIRRDENLSKRKP